MSRRIAYVLASYPVILGMVGSHDRITSTLPDDAVVSHLVLLPESQQVQVYFTSDQLEAVPEAGIIPRFDPYLTSHREEAIAVSV